MRLAVCSRIVDVVTFVTRRDSTEYLVKARMGIEPVHIKPQKAVFQT
jgi:hypothetical protein